MRGLRKLRGMDDEELRRAQRDLLAEIAIEARDTVHWTGRERFSERVMAAMTKVPRHEFVLPEDVCYAYANRPRMIGHGQTISQPYMVAVMTDLLDLEPEDRVLEIGAGSGYQAAVLAEVAGRVFTVEVVEALADGARERLRRLGYDNIEVRTGDGYAGWPEEAPFDGIMVTAAPESIPEALVEQLKPGRRMVIPVGRPYETQTLYVCVKEADGGLRTERSLPVAFVPMVHARQIAQ
jgi:protein-L-isoaspartate(D-aspartate) O-methyltransferase